MTKTLLLADTQPIVRTGIMAALDQCDGVQICGETDSDSSTEREIESLRPDLVIMDVMQPGLNGIRMIESVTSTRLDTRFLIFSCREVSDLDCAFRAGACGYVSKHSPIVDLQRGVAAVLRGEYDLPAHIIRRLLGVGSDASSPAVSLTTRERQVLRCVAMGQSNRAVASALGVKVRTVEAHRASLMRKIGLHNAADVTRYAIRMGLVDI